MRWLPCVLGVLVLSGCYSDRDRFNEDYPVAYCKRLRKCDVQAFEDGFEGDLEQCIDARRYLHERWHAHCEYDPEAARECIRATPRVDCEQPVELPICRQVYRDCHFDADM